MLCSRRFRDRDHHTLDRLDKSHSCSYDDRMFDIENIIKGLECKDQHVGLIADIETEM